MNPHSLPTDAQARAIPDIPPEVRRQAGEIQRLRATLFELQCEPEPDAFAIDGVMQRLAIVRLGKVLN